MKNNDPKAYDRLKNVLAMILVASIVIGLMSSTAIKLVTATYLMQNSRKKITTNIPFVDNIINNVIDDGSSNSDGNSDNNSSSDSSSDSSSNSSSSSSDSNTTTEADKDDETTKAPTTEKPADTDDSVQSVKEKQSSPHFRGLDCFFEGKEVKIISAAGALLRQQGKRYR